MLRYARLRFVCQWDEAGRRLRSPLHWRNDLENSLRRVACVLPRHKCSHCVVRDRCTYVGLFLPQEAKTVSGKSQIQMPLPFALLLPGSQEKSEVFELEVTLLEPWVSRLPYWIFALEEVGKQRSHPFTVLKGLEWTGRGWSQFYQGAQRYLEGVAVPREPIPVHLGKVAIFQWLTPGRLFKLGRPLISASFQDLIEALVRRIENLERWYGRPEGRDYKWLVTAARDVNVEPMDLRWVESHFHSKRQNASIALGGLMGAVILKGDLEPFGRILALGRDLGVGKKTALGLGRFEVAEPQ